MSAAIQPQPVAPPSNISIADRAGQYVAVRDKIKEIKDRHKAELAPYERALDMLNDILLGHLNTAGVESMASTQGTFYRSRKLSVTIADGEAFRAWVIDQGAWNMVDWKASKTAVDAYVAANEALPPGVNMSVFYEAGVRRPSNKE